MPQAWRDHLAVVGLMSAAACLAIGPWAIRKCAAKGWVQPLRYDDCPPLQAAQQRKRGTPTMGGLLVIGVAGAIAAMCGGFSRAEGWVVAAALVGLGGLGFADDILKLRRPNAGGLRCRPKLLWALGLGAAIGWWLTRLDPEARLVAIPWTSVRVDLGWAVIPCAMLIVAGCAHAVNLSDGMDGLAAGLLAIAFGACGLIAACNACAAGAALPPAAIWCASLAGACLAFLWFNAHPASVFLGDVGALGLGAALAAVALVSHAALALAIVGGVFVAEAGSVMLQVASYQWRNKRRIFRVAPLHHHVHLGGVSEQTVVVRFWLAGLACAALGVTAVCR